MCYREKAAKAPPSCEECGDEGGGGVAVEPSRWKFHNHNRVIYVRARPRPSVILRDCIYFTPTPGIDNNNNNVSD